MALVQQLIQDAQQANTVAEEVRKRLVALQENVASGVVQETVAADAHHAANTKRISVWRQVIEQIDLGL